MPHVGNDIVDLTQSTAKKKSRNIRFLNRVFTPDEQDFILSSSAFPELRLWCCWAAKEAAYKAISKACPDIPAIPKLFPVSIDPEGHEDSGTESPDIQGLFFPRLSAGSVLTPAGRCWIRIEYRHTYLHCLAFTHAPDTLSVFRHVHYLSSSLQGGARSRYRGRPAGGKVLSCGTAFRAFRGPGDCPAAEGIFSGTAPGLLPGPAP